MLLDVLAPLDHLLQLECAKRNLSELAVPEMKTTYLVRALAFYYCREEGGCWNSGRFTRNFFRVPKRSLHFRLLATLAQKRRQRSIR